MDLPRDLVGIVTLRQRLSKVLLAQIRAELPSLVGEIEGSIQRYKRRLETLGESRNGLDEQRLFLLRISQAFQSLVKAAVDGTYGDPFFGDPWSREGYGKRLRAIIQNLNLDFAEAMRTRGHHWQIVDHVKIHNKPEKSSTDDPLPETVAKEVFIDKIQDLLSRTRGRDLPGMFNPLIVGDLFSDQSRPWEILATRHVELTWEAARTFLDLVVSFLTDGDTAEVLLKEVIDPVMETKLVCCYRTRSRNFCRHFGNSTR